MSHHRDDVVRHALAVLDRYGLESLTMRRLASDLDVRPSALYWHFASKQALLAAVAEEVLAPLHTLPARTADDPWEEQVRAWCRGLRDAVLAHRDGAEVVATTWSFGLGARAPYDGLVAVLGNAAPHGAALPRQVAEAAALTLLHFTFGHTTDEQTHLQANSAGAIDTPVATMVASAADSYGLGLDLVLDGVRARADAR
ncbi:MAG: TetR/AcrR family transcriptional regulator C-terminal domain-containing protein [Nocardioides sp.]|nr:TetR/AcrR family transcriptional regulator C-terminal domain-containing protein [Nocardioides sp.]